MRSSTPVRVTQFVDITHEYFVVATTVTQNAMRVARQECRT